MCKNGLKKYMLLKKEEGEEVSIFRVLELMEEKVLVIDCVKKLMLVLCQDLVQIKMRSSAC